MAHADWGQLVSGGAYEAVSHGYGYHLPAGTLCELCAQAIQLDAGQLVHRRGPRRWVHDTCLPVKLDRPARPASCQCAGAVAVGVAGGFHVDAVACDGCGVLIHFAWLDLSGHHCPVCAGRSEVRKEQPWLTRR